MGCAQNDMTAYLAFIGCLLLLAPGAPQYQRFFFSVLADTGLSAQMGTSVAKFHRGIADAIESARKMPLETRMLLFFYLGLSRQARRCGTRLQSLCVHAHVRRHLATRNRSAYT